MASLECPVSFMRNSGATLAWKNEDGKSLKQLDEQA
jgi:hypothetical protein